MAALETYSAYCAGSTELEQSTPAPLGWQLSEGMRVR